MVVAVSGTPAAATSASPGARSGDRSRGRCRNGTIEICCSRAVLVCVPNLVALGADTNICTCFRTVHVVPDALLLPPTNPLFHLGVRIRNVCGILLRVLRERSKHMIPIQLTAPGLQDGLLEEVRGHIHPRIQIPGLKACSNDMCA